MVYKHDDHGKPLYGNKDKVIEAVQNGLSVRIGYGRQISDERSIEHVADAQFLSVLNDHDSKEVFAQISPIMRQGPYRQNDTIGIKLEAGYKWLTAIGTNGMASNVMVHTFADTLDGSNQNRRGAVWFVDYPHNFEPINKTLAFD